MDETTNQQDMNETPETVILHWNQFDLSTWVMLFATLLPSKASEHWRRSCSCICNVIVISSSWRSRRDSMRSRHARIDSSCLGLNVKLLRLLRALGDLELGNHGPPLEKSSRDLLRR